LIVHCDEASNLGVADAFEDRCGVEVGDEPILHARDLVGIKEGGEVSVSWQLIHTNGKVDKVVACRTVVAEVVAIVGKQKAPTELVDLVVPIVPTLAQKVPGDCELRARFVVPLQTSLTLVLEHPGAVAAHSDLMENDDAH